jgi:hypothetical protein
VSRQSPEAAIQSIEAVADFLIGHGHNELGQRAARNGEQLRSGDLAGAQELVEWSRAFTDVYFSPVNGNAVDDEAGYRLTREFRALYSRAFDAADHLLRVGESPE